MWLHYLIPALIAIASVGGVEPEALYCLDFEASYNNTHPLTSNWRVTLVYPEYGEACYLKIIYYLASDGNCYPISLVSGVVPEIEMHQQPAKPHIRQYVLQCRDRNFCSAKLAEMEQYLREKRDVNDECLLSVARVLPKWWPKVDRKVLYAQQNEEKLDKAYVEHVFLNNGSRYFVNFSLSSRCFDFYQYVDEPFEESAVAKVLGEGDTCSLNIKFDAYYCKPIRVRLSRGYPRIPYRFIKDKDDDDAFKFGTWCQGDYCNRNLSYLAETIRWHYAQNNLTRCVLEAIEEVIKLYNDPLENIYQTHLSLSNKEQQRIEENDNKSNYSDKTNLDPIVRKPKPLIERFQPVNQELLRESDYQIEMLKKSHMWIQYTILTYTTLAITISVTYGIRKKMKEEAFYNNRINLH